MAKLVDTGAFWGADVWSNFVGRDEAIEPTEARLRFEWSSLLLPNCWSFSTRRGGLGLILIR